MTSDAYEDTVELLGTARRLYEDDGAALAALDDLSARLGEPLRLAVAGIVKAGKSTLLNALLGEQIAPTDTGECTRVVTWYRYSDTPSITLHPLRGKPRRLPVTRSNGKLVLDLGTLTPEEVERIDISWPSRVLRSLILIDTPGIASLSLDVSARSAAFLTPEDAPSSADAIVYLLRHLHPADVKFLEAFRDTAAGASKTVNAVAVLSRADEIGSGRIDSLLSARKVAMRYEQQGGLASLALGVLPVAGLLAEGARTLREDEFAAFRALADLERSERERLLVSADRFGRPGEVNSPDVAVRRRLLDRFGIFGVRLAISMIRAGASDSTELTQRLVEYSGLNELSDFVRLHFGQRVDALKVRGVLDGLTSLLRDKPHEGASPILGGIERILATAHSLRELSLISEARAAGLPLSPDRAAAAVRIVGGDGTEVTARLGLPEDADADAISTALTRQLDQWRALSQSPLTERSGVEICRVVIRSLEALASDLGPGGTDRPLEDIVLPRRPLEGAREGAHQ